VNLGDDIPSGDWWEVGSSWSNDSSSGRITIRLEGSNVNPTTVAVVPRLLDVHEMDLNRSALDDLLVIAQHNSGGVLGVVLGGDNQSARDLGDTSFGGKTLNDLAGDVCAGDTQIESPTVVAEE
jgi:hypothetical protein